MSEVNLDRMEKLIGMGFEKEKAYEMVKAEAEESTSKSTEENDKIKQLEQELEVAKKELGEKDKDKDKDDKPATKDDKQIDPKELKKKNEDEPEYIQVLKKFC